MKTPLLLTTLMATLAAASDAPVTKRTTLTLEGARRVISTVTAEAKKNNAGAAVAVVDEGGNLIAIERVDGTFPAGPNIAIGKARTAALFQRPTKFFEDVIAKGRTSMVTLDDFTPLQGGVPIMVDGQIIGAVGVSGASSAQQDTEFATAGAAALTNTAAMPSGVSYLDSKKVSAAFAKGMPLIEVGGYKIHASRREGSGQAEVHERDTDIVHVLGGSATLVTGGSAVDATTIAPEEIRGATIKDGQSRRLSPGDVVVIPNGVPHQFLDVEAPFTYYVVKVRS
jgi:uncharacterized protein GlcG (DUF336 family)/mannose-6-phosphate isomerase-like protein (cupin superfamily)